MLYNKPKYTHTLTHEPELPSFSQIHPPVMIERTLKKIKCFACQSCCFVYVCFMKKRILRSIIKYPYYLVSVIDLLAGASRSTTPLSLLSRNKSPSADMAVQVNQQQNVGNRDAGHKRQQNQQPISRGTYNRDRRDSGRGGNDYGASQYDNRNQYQRNNNNNQQNRGGWMNRNNNMNMNNMRNPNNRGGRGNGGPPRMSNQVSF